MSFEILNNKVKKMIDEIDESLKKIKENVKERESQSKNIRDIAVSKEAITSGVGGLFFILQLLKSSMNTYEMMKFTERQKFSKDSKEFLKNIKDRYEIVQKAEKQGLKVDFDVVEDLRDFIKEAGQFERSDFAEKLAKFGLKDDYINLSKESSSLFEKVEIKDEKSEDKTQKKLTQGLNYEQ